MSQQIFNRYLFALFTPMPNKTHFQNFDNNATPNKILYNDGDKTDTFLSVFILHIDVTETFPYLVCLASIRKGGKLFFRCCIHCVSPSVFVSVTFLIIVPFYIIDIFVENLITYYVTLYCICLSHC